MILKTERLLLRPMAEADAPALFAILGDPEAMAFWDREALPRLATAEAQMADELAAMAAGGFLYWTVLRDGDAVGFVDLSHIDGVGAWAGFAFRRDVWGQGLAREALAAVMAHAFGPQRLIRLMARVQTANGRARRLLENAGFQKEGELPGVVRGGEIRPCLRYGLNKSIIKNGAQ
jgi:ribosomal-protein-alanine N-acetyltransferase